jgi:uncharacterized protein
LKIRVDTIPESGKDVDYSREPDRFPVLADMASAGGCRFLSPVRVRLHLRWVREMIEADGTIETEVRTACRRCMASHEIPIRQRFTVHYTHELPDLSEADTGDGVELTADVIGMIPFSGDTIDLTEMIQEQVVLGVPPWPLCHPDCRGLCPQCGADLNRGTCDCEAPVLDDRFAILKTLKLDESG